MIFLLISPDRPHPARHMGAVVRVGRPIQSLLHQTLLGRDDPDLKIHGDDEPHEHAVLWSWPARTSPAGGREDRSSGRRVAADRKGPFLCKIGAHGFKVGPRADGGQRGRDVPKQRGEGGEGHDEEGEPRPESRQRVPRGEKGQRGGASQRARSPPPRRQAQTRRGGKTGMSPPSPTESWSAPTGGALSVAAEPLGQRVDEQVLKRAYLYKFS